MQLLLARLSEILLQEIVQYGKLLEILSIERYTIASDSIEQIHETLKHQKTLILELKALEEARVAVMHKLAEYFHSSSQELTLLELASQIDEPFASEYEAYSQQFAQLLGQLEQVNLDNAYLIDRSLDYVNNSLRLFFASNLFGIGYLDKNLTSTYGQGKHIYETI